MTGGDFEDVNVRSTTALLNGALVVDRSWLPSPTFEGVTYATRATLQCPQPDNSSVALHSPGGPRTALVTDGPIMSLESGAFLAGPAVLLNNSLRIDQSWLPSPTFDGVTYTTRATLQCPQAADSSVALHSPGGPRTALVTDGPIMSLESGAFFAGRVGIGTSAPQAALHVNGDIRIRDRTLPVPDHVFAADYALRSLDELGEYIDTNGRLPEMPSAATLGEEGVDLGQFCMTLLQKIEELSLYVLAQHRTVGELGERIGILEAGQ